MNNKCSNSWTYIEGFNLILTTNKSFAVYTQFTMFLLNLYIVYNFALKSNFIPNCFIVPLLFRAGILSTISTPIFVFSWPVTIFSVTFLKLVASAPSLNRKADLLGTFLIVSSYVCIQKNFQPSATSHRFGTSSVQQFLPQTVSIRLFCKTSSFELQKVMWTFILTPSWSSLCGQCFIKNLVSPSQFLWILWHISCSQQWKF